MLVPLLRTLETRLAQGLREDAARAGLREATARILLALGGDDAVSMTGLARRVGRDPTTTTRFVDRAEAQGLVRRERSVRDGRRRVVQLTAKGDAARATLVEAQQRRAGAIAEAMLAETGLGRGQIEWFARALAGALRPSDPPGHKGSPSRIASEPGKQPAL